MVTNDHHSLKQVLNIIGNKGFHQSDSETTYSCPYCQMSGLTEDEMWHHIPLYHVNDPMPSGMQCIQCPICRQSHKHRNFLLHLRNNHGPTLRGEVMPESKEGILTHAFALVVVRRPTDNKFLVVQEANQSGFWLPGGRVDVGETLLEAAIRETKQEAGIDVDIKGVLKVEHSTYQYDERERAYNRMRIIFYAEPIDAKELPKSVPDFYSTGATFISVDELDKIRLRADEPKEWFMALTDNLYYHSLDILSCWKHDHRTNNNQRNQKCKNVEVDDEPIPSNIHEAEDDDDDDEEDGDENIDYDDKEDEDEYEYSLSSEDFADTNASYGQVKQHPQSSKKSPRRHTTHVTSPTVKNKYHIARLNGPGKLSKFKSAETAMVSMSMRNVYSGKSRKKISKKQHPNTPTDASDATNISMDNRPKMANLGSASNHITPKHALMKKMKKIGISKSTTSVFKDLKSPTPNIKSPPVQQQQQAQQQPQPQPASHQIAVYQFAPQMIGYHQPYLPQHPHLQFAPPPNNAQLMQPTAFYPRAISDPSKSTSQNMNESNIVYQIPVSQAAAAQFKAQPNQYAQFQSNVSQMQVQPQRFSVVQPVIYAPTPLSQQQQQQQQSNNSKKSFKQPQPQIKAPVIDKSMNERKGKRRHRRSLSNGALPMDKENAFRLQQIPSLKSPTKQKASIAKK